MRRVKANCSHFLIFLIVWILPSICSADFDHVLYYKQIGKYKLLIAFPQNAADSSRAVLFSDNDWHLPRYIDSQEIKDFFSALGFKDQSARLKLRRKFQPDAVNDKFTSWSWQLLFDWLVDMKIEEIDGITLLLKELSFVKYDSLDQAFKNRDYFPKVYNLKKYLPKIEIEVNNLKTNLIEFGEVDIGTQKKLKVLLTARNISNSILFISPIYDSYLDKSITINKSNKPILLYNEVPETLEVVFSPSDSLIESKFWQNDTLNFFIPLIGDYLPAPAKIFITGVRKTKISKIEFFLNQYYKSIVILIVSIMILGIIFWLYQRHNYHKQQSIKNFIIPRIDFNKNKHVEITSAKSIKKYSLSYHLKHINLGPLQIKIKAFVKQIKQFWIELYKKNQLSSADVNLINMINRLYYQENAEISEFIKIIQNHFEQDKDHSKKLFKALLIENQKIKEKDEIIDNLQWYKESFHQLKNLSGHKNLDDIAVKKVLIDKICYSHSIEVYNLIEKYCYSPILTNYEKFNDTNKPINENIDIFQRNREKLLNQKKQIQELLSINKEHKYFIEGIKQGYINIKTQTDDLENFQLDYEQFLIIQGLCSNLIDAFASFLRTVVAQFNNVDRSNTSECWLKIINNILAGRSGIAGIKGCLERLDSFRDPLILMRFFEINNKESIKKLNEESIKSKFIEKLILTPFCMPYLQDLRRLYLYLENKELRSNTDENLFSIVTSLNDKLYEQFKRYNIYLHQLKLFTKFDQKWSLLAKEQSDSISYLEQTESTKLKLKNLISVGRLIDNYIYDVDLVGYDIISKGEKDKSEDSQVYVYNKLTNAIY